jgi:hypothetical protein
LRLRLKRNSCDFVSEPFERLAILTEITDGGALCSLVWRLHQASFLSAGSLMQLDAVLWKTQTDLHECRLRERPAELD